MGDKLMNSPKYYKENYFFYRFKVLIGKFVKINSRVL